MNRRNILKYFAAMLAGVMLGAKMIWNYNLKNSNNPVGETSLP